MVRKMGSIQTTHHSETSSSSSDEKVPIDIDEDLPDDNIIEKRAKEIWDSSSENTSELNIDAAINTNVLKTSQLIKNLSLNDVKFVESNLDYYELVSLVFLLFNNSNYALRALKSNKNILYDWAKYKNEIGDKWQEKLIEGLNTIQNFKILKKLGFNKVDLQQKYVNYPLITLDIDKTRKLLYYICENLNKKQIEIFLVLVKKDFQCHNLEFIYFDNRYMEFYFLYWESINYISKDNLNNIEKFFKHMDLLTIQELCNRITSINNSNGTMTDDNTTASSNNIRDEIIKRNNNRNETDRCYSMDENNPGVLLIINQVYFYREVDPLYRHLLPPVDVQLEDREGSEEDKEKLIETFKKLNFRVKVVENRTHDEILEDIKAVAHEIRDESSFFVCILSHGEKGVVFGCNSCKVEVEDIKKIMCMKNRKYLTGKPKVLLLQSCQGDQCQRLPNDDEDDLSMDGPNGDFRSPLFADMLVFWATVPGFGAIRNKKTGTWFIQTLCEQILKLTNECHFFEICTNVNNEISKKIWKQGVNKEVVMMPVWDTTFRKSLYLPKI